MKSATPDQIGKVDYFHPETQIGLVYPPAFHNFLIGIAREGDFQVNIKMLLEHNGHHPFNRRAKTSSGSNKRHFDIDLGMFRLPVGTEILIAQTTGDLEIFIESGNHQNLFE